MNLSKNKLGNLIILELILKIHKFFEKIRAKELITPQPQFLKLVMTI
jgi:hypothetical protein